MSVQALVEGAVVERADRGTPLLAVERLTVDAESVRLVDGVDLTLRAGERVALVGESGSGKSVTARALLRLDPGLRLGGAVRLTGTDLLTLPIKAMSAVRGRRIGMVFQDPMGALDPLQTIGDQVAEPLRVRGMRRREAQAAVRTLLDDLGVDRADERMRAYPHEFSGGMRQRVVLAMALVGEPELLIADEPTTALDVRVQKQVLRLLDTVCAERGLAVLLITHDLGVVAGFAERVVVMYAGRAVEERAIGPIYREPAHPYTAGLLGAVPRVDRLGERLEPIPGAPPSPSARPSGCAFHPRCPKAMDRCADEVPAWRPVPAGRAACHLLEES